jgi:uncharacterized membrane protein SpoIIM required for sporulation
VTSDERLALDALSAEVRALSATVSQLSVKFENNAKATEDHEQRMRKLEAWRNALPVSTLIFLGTTAIALVGLFIKT